VEVEKMLARFDLVENGGYVGHRRGLSHDHFLKLKNKFSELGYPCEPGKG